jgi:hypothetical protein
VAQARDPAVVVQAQGVAARAQDPAAVRAQVEQVPAEQV